MEISKFSLKKNITVKTYIINSLTKSSQNFDNLYQFRILLVYMLKLDIKKLEKIHKKLAYSS
jgi:hypothetical protein